MIVNKFIGEKLRESRKCWGFKQREVANYLSISQGQLSKIEGGTRKCPPDLFEKLCCLYNIDEKWFDGDGKVRPLTICTIDI